MSSLGVFFLLLMVFHINPPLGADEAAAKFAIYEEDTETPVDVSNVSHNVQMPSRSNITRASNPHSQAALPVEWNGFVSPIGGRTFYVNSVTGATQWERPTAFV